jgi:hypothetical protein
MNESATKPSDLGVTILFQAFVAIRFENIPHLVAPQGCHPFATIAFIIKSLVT